MSFLLDWFLPHHGNNHKARLIRSYSLFLLSLFFILTQFSLTFFTFAKPAVLGYSSNITPERIIELTNAERAKLGLNALKENRLLSEAARQKAADMFAFNYWAHVSPSGRTPWSFFTDVGYRYQYAGENLARDFRDPDSVVAAWMNSPSHKENIVSSKYEEIGVAVVDGTLQGIETTLVVQLFGTQYGAAVSHREETSSPANAFETRKETAPVANPIKSLGIETKEFLSNRTGREIAIISPLSLVRGITIFIVGVLIGVFLVDGLLVSHRETHRFSSRSLAQMMFLIFVLFLSLMIKEGVVL